MEEFQFKMLDLYFKNINFNQLRVISKEPIKLKIQHSFEFARSNDKQQIRVTISTSINAEDNRLGLNLDTVALFEVPADKEFNENENQLLVNIMYPYVRSQVSLVTTQPGLLPINLPLQFPPVKKKEDNKSDSLIV